MMIQTFMKVFSFWKFLILLILFSSISFRPLLRKILFLFTPFPSDFPPRLENNPWTQEVKAISNHLPIWMLNFFPFNFSSSCWLMPWVIVERKVRKERKQKNGFSSFTSKPSLRLLCITKVVFRALKGKPKKYDYDNMKMTSAHSASRVEMKWKICLRGFVSLMYKWCEKVKPHGAARKKRLRREESDKSRKWW